MKRATAIIHDEQFFFVSVDGDDWLGTTPDKEWTEDDLACTLSGKAGILPMTMTTDFLKQFDFKIVE